MATGWGSRAGGLVVGFALLAVIVVLDVALGPSVVISGSYGVAAVASSAMTSVRRTALVATVALGLTIVSGAWNQNFATLDWAIRICLSIGLGLVAVLAARVRVRREQDLRHMTVIAETAQRAVLRAMPTAVGSVGFAARYVSATQEALVGGDLYEVADSPYGVRVIVGDVRGKGLDAVQMAGTVLGAFRRAALTQPSLPEIATDLDAVVRAIAGDEDFVTAVLAEFHADHTVTLVNCGHHPPLLVAEADTARELTVTDPVPPLGLGPTPSPVTSEWPQGSRVLIYTDGLVEARNRRGVFFPLAEHALALREGTLDEALERLLAHLTAHSQDRIRDDMALVLVEHRTA